MNESKHRIIGETGDALSPENLTREAARKQHDELTQQKVTHFWQAWGGLRTGWNSVTAWWSDTALVRIIERERQAWVTPEPVVHRPVRRRKKVDLGPVDAEGNVAFGHVSALDDGGQE